MGDDFIRTESKLSVDAAVKKVEEASKAGGFGVLNTLNLQQIMASKGTNYLEAATVVEICRPGDAKAFLEADSRLAPCLPCRIAVTSDAGKTFVHTVRPSAMMRMFQNPAVEKLAGAMDAQIEKIVMAAK